jgi:tetratricopeptide (TPR) repeat protein
MVEKTVAEFNRKLDALTEETSEVLASRSQLISSIIRRQDEVSERLLKLRPNDTLLHAANSVLIGDWKNAAAGYAKLTEPNEKADSAAWMVPPTLWAYAGEFGRHRALCQKMHERYRDSTVPEDTERYLKIMLLVQSGPELPPEAVTKFLASIDHSKGETRAWFTEARALLECRQGKYAEALKSVDEALALLKQTPNASIKCIGLTVRSLTYTKLRDFAKARESLDQVKQVMSKDLKMNWKADGLLDGRTILNGVTVEHDKLIPEIIRREAEKLIQAAAGSPNDNTPAK